MSASSAIEACWRVAALLRGTNVAFDRGPLLPAFGPGASAFYF